MKLKSFIASASAGAAAIVLLTPLLACGGEVEASVERNQNENGSHTTTTKGSVHLTWLTPSARAPTLNYSISFMEYPSNRMVLAASASYPNGLNEATPGQVAVLPVELTPGTHYTVQYQVGSWERAYDMTLASQTGMSQGTYLMDCPGMMEDVVMATRNYPNSPVIATISGQQGSSLTALLPSLFSGLSSADTPGHLTITVPGSQTYLIAQTVVTRPDDQVPGNHGPITKTMGD